ncbi:MAG TPA: CoA-binding protein [Tepidisphaeraceae bacterium]|nr:CoA-binding protein [Tepidisphaeraceae bacterium]
MSNEACPMPSRGQGSDAAAIERMLSANRIAVVGLSDDPGRPSFQIASYLRGEGYEIVPVNPTHAAVMGLKSYPTLQDVPGQVDVVNVFRRPAFCADITRDAIAIGAKGVWLQSGIRDDEAKEIAAAAGIDFVQDRCIMIEHRMRCARVVSE